MKFIIAALLIAAVLGDKYGLVFGTKDNWHNYSIQSNPCRQYADLVRAGFKPDHILMMAYDSCKTSSSNPFPGMIFTDPAEDTEGDWAKYGCWDNLDYTGKDINAKVFLAILEGDAKKVTELTGIENPKVLSATKEDQVFIYFIDHGSDDIICVGNDYVHAAELVGAFQTAYDKGLYGELVFYMEACHSGSMWEKLPDNINMYVMSASDSHHNAYMSNCSPNDVVAGKHLGTCLSGLWDNAYMDEVERDQEQTLGEIFTEVYDEVAKSSDQNVSEFGDFKMHADKISKYVGTIPGNNLKKRSAPESIVRYDEVPRHLALWKAIRSSGSELKSALKELEEVIMADAKKEVEVMRLGRMVMDEKAADRATKLQSEKYSQDCYEEILFKLHEVCGHDLPYKPESINLIKSICLPGLQAPNVDYKQIC